MKKLILLSAIVVGVMSCKEEPPKDYVTLTGTITNQNSDSVMIRTRTFSKTIAVNEDGTFSDTLKVEPGIYSLYDGTEATSIFLKNGYEIDVTLDTEMFDETVKYSGVGAENSNFLAERALLSEKLLDRDFDGLDENELKQTMSEIKAEMMDLIDSKSDLDSLVVAESQKSVESTINSYQGYFMGEIALRRSLPAGTPSPVFEDYENYAGGTSSLSDFKGKYVYIDVWATWCGPCKVEIPFLKKLEEEFHGKNIEFISVSIDDDRTHKGSWDLANSDWKAFVAEKELGGVQVWAPAGWKSKFITDYKINGIPRFILVDPDGNIINASAPRPSNPKLREMLQEMI